MSLLKQSAAYMCTNKQHVSMGRATPTQICAECLRDLWSDVATLKAKLAEVTYFLGWDKPVPVNTGSTVVTVKPLEPSVPNRAEALRRVLLVLAPDGMPAFEWGHETTPSLEDVTAMANHILNILGWPEPQR